MDKEQFDEKAYEEYRRAIESLRKVKAIREGDVEEPEELEFIDFEYDLEFFGGDYDDTGGMIGIPVSLIDDSLEEEESMNRAFERYMGLSRVHIIHWESETLDPGDSNAFVLDQRIRQEELDEHIPTCKVCQALNLTPEEVGEPEPEQESDYFNESQAISAEKLITIELSSGGPADGYQLVYNESGGLMSGEYYYMWDHTRRFNLSESELDLVVELYEIDPDNF